MEIPTDWTFQNVAVADGFDRHVREQLPWYELMSGAVAHIARHYLPDQGTVLDVGSSTGNIGRKLQAVLESRAAKYIAIDNAAEMAGVYHGPGDLIISDIRTMEVPQHDVAVMFLVLMFIEPRLRPEVLAKIKAKVRPGGVLIVVDKMESTGGYLGTVLARLTLAGKKASGCSGDEIIDKELSLSGVQRPMKPAELAGFSEVFRFGEFAGYVCEV